MRNYRSTSKGKKRSILSNWRFAGLVGDYDLIYDRYIKAKNCEFCGCLMTKEKEGGRQKCMEHNHRTGEFRGIVCQKCNTTQLDRKRPTHNTSGHTGICFMKEKSGKWFWVYRKQHEGKTFKIQRKNKTELLCLKFAYLILLNHNKLNRSS
jgi:hypothetical protein